MCSSTSLFKSFGNIIQATYQGKQKLVAVHHANIWHKLVKVCDDQFWVLPK